MISTTDIQLSDGTFFGLGHPMLDISTQVSLEFLERYNLQANNVVLAGSVSNYDELSNEILNKGNYKLNYSPGGSTLNTFKTIKWFLEQDNLTTYMGCIGQDEHGKKLQQQQMNNCLYQINSDLPTATCLILITDQARSMITNLAAANEFTIDYLNQSDNWLYVERAKIFYVSGYFIRTCLQAVLKLAQHAEKKRKIFALNLSAEYICEKFGEDIMKLLPLVDFLFGNEQEAKCFAQHHLNIDTNTDITHIAEELQKKLSKSTDTCVIITRGANPIVLASKNGVKMFTVKRPPKIIDTIGCGDAFAGGFLAYWSLNTSIDDCINAACYCAYECLLQTECQFTNPSSFNATKRYCNV
ncbi:unnamed protein product [Adineta steineri]|uniref:Adenosine kinase n=1 Tax=Adineta steineri TaxID=433720 RepID=A0A818LNG1_9BILA|nr:unnamed protein product [Adineta steineri]CAF3575036.1 unnamed protein product [Adineta steineri]